MQTVTRSKTGTGQSNVLVPDYMVAPFQIGIAAVVTGTATFNIEYSLDSEEAFVDWFVYPGFSALTASTAGILEIPCKGLRINITSGAGTVVASFVQAGRK